jgi:chloramphenicol O-acetyltransferase
MAIRKKEERKDHMIHIDLTGPEGNAFVLLAYATKFCKQLGYDATKTQNILDEMRLTDYEGLLYTFDREFGLFCTLWR